MTFDNQSNARRTAVESKSIRSYNRRTTGSTSRSHLPWDGRTWSDRCRRERGTWWRRWRERRATCRRRAHWCVVLFRWTQTSSSTDRPHSARSTATRCPTNKQQHALALSYCAYREFVLLLLLCGTVAWWLGRRTWDQQVAGSTPGRRIALCKSLAYMRPAPLKLRPHGAIEFWSI